MPLQIRTVFLWTLWAAATVCARAQSAALTPDTNQLSAGGGNVTFTATVAYANTPTALGFQVDLPTGWAYVSGAGEPSIKPDVGTTGTLEWAYTSGFGATASSFEFTVSYPAGLSGVQTIAASAVYRSPLTNLPIASVVLSPAVATAPPSFTLGPPDRVINAGENTSFTVAVSGAPTPTLRWQYSADDGNSWSDLPGGGMFAGVTDATLSITGATIALDGQRYRALASNSVQVDVPSTSARLTVNTPPPAATLSSSNGNYSAFGGTISLTATLTYSKDPTSLGFQVDLPAGWSYEGGVNEPTIKPEPGTTDSLEWAYSSGFGSGSSSFTFTLRYATGLSGNQNFSGTAIYRSPLASIPLAPLVLTQTASAYQDWQAAHFAQTELADSALSGSQADPDNDGLSNLVEYGLALDPKNASAIGVPGVSADAANWLYTYTRPADRSDLAYSVEVSTNLTTWTTAGVTLDRIAIGSGTETWRARYPIAGTPVLFFRLKVATAP